jgi:RNA polymerase sigma factor (sigma-70 family)
MTQRAANAARLRAFIEAEADTLRGTLRLYIRRAGLAQGDAVASAADDLLHDVVVEALAHAERFRPSGQPQAWLLGIAANLIRRRQADLARRTRREPLARDLHPVQADGPPAEDDVFDRLAALSTTMQQIGPEAALEAHEGAAALLDSVSTADREILGLAILYEMNGAALAEALAITPGAARVRLHRALNRLRAALQAEGVTHD